MKDLQKFVWLRGLGYVVAIVSRGIISVSRGVATDDECN